MDRKSKAHIIYEICLDETTSVCYTIITTLNRCNVITRVIQQDNTKSIIQY